MLYLLGDTCVWLDLAKSNNGEQIIAVCRGLINQEQLELLVPQIVIDEFERNRGRIEADMARSVTATFHQVRAAVDEHGQGDGREETLKQLDDLTHRVPLINQMAIWQFSEILVLLQGGRRLDPSDEVHRRAVDRALTRRAPFHRSKNSVADALIIEMYGEVLAADVAGADDHCFVTSNIKDFSLGTGDSRLPHADIAEYFANPRSRYFTSLATAVTAYFPPEETDDLVAELAYYDEPRNLSEIMPLLDKLWDQIWYNRHKNLAYKIEVGEVEIVDEYSPKEHQRTVVRSVWEGALASARRMEEKWSRPGDSLRRSIDHGLLTSQAGIVVLSPAFFAKRWTAYELDGLVQLDAGSPDQVAGHGQGSRIIPVWHDVGAEEVAGYSPSFGQSRRDHESRGR